MRSPLRILVILAVAALAAAACSSTVTTTERLGAAETSSTTPASEATEQTAQSPESSASADDDQADPESAADESGGDAADSDDDNEEPASARDLQSAPGFRLGDAEQLGALSDDCIAGSDMACDILFQLSAFDSEEEATAVTCGGRSDVEVSFCTEGIETGPTELVFDEDSPGLTAIIEACRDDGDMTACDFLYVRSPLESAIEAIGASCGERVEVAVPDCRSFLTEAE